MKYKNIWLLAALLSLGACNLDTPPENQLTQNNAFLTERDLNGTTTAIHAIMNHAMADNGLPVFIDAGEISSEQLNGNSIKHWNPKSVLNFDSDWKGLYDMLFTAHILLDNIHRTTNLPQDRQNYHRGQAYFALGFGYLNLVQRFGDCILLKNSTYLDEYSTTPQLTVLNKAIEYATEAYNMLPLYSELRDQAGIALTAKQFASKGSAAALLAHLYAWKGGVIDNYKLQGEDSRAAYSKAIEYAGKVISGEVGRYELCSSTEELCQKLSTPTQDNPEVIFSVIFDRSRSGGASESPLPTRRYVSYPVDKTKTLGDLTEATEYRVYKSKINQVYPEANDARRKAYFYEIDKEHNVNGNDYALVYKWRNAIYESNSSSELGQNLRSLDADFVYWRLADMYLLRAECLAKLNRDAEAIADLNVIRKRAETPEYSSAMDANLKLAIFREREREFFAEGHRYWDVIRNGLWKTELEGNFRTLTDQDVLGGALHLPTPESAFKRNGITINTRIRQSNYWSRYK